MKHWVYIYEDEKKCLKTALETSDINIISIQQLNLRILYLCPFEIPFDAIAHKYLLDYLSKETVLEWIDKYKEKTKQMLEVSF